jgi:predicted RNase H-like HicB family nuclease
MVTQLKKDLNYYLNLPWTFTVRQDDEQGKIFIVSVEEWPGVTTDAPSIREAIDGIYEALTLAIEMALEGDDLIPEPQHQELFKGNIAYRTTPERHYLIAREAKKRNLSLSQLLDMTVDKNLRGEKKA